MTSSNKENLNKALGLQEKAMSPKIKNPKNWSKADLKSYLSGRKLKQHTGSLRGAAKKPGLLDLLQSRAATKGGSKTSHTRKAFWAGMAGVKTPQESKEEPSKSNEATNPLTTRNLMSPAYKREMASQGTRRKLTTDQSKKRQLATQGTKRDFATQSQTRVWGR